MRSYITQYVKDKRGRRIGCVVAAKANDTIHIGGSLCSPHDKFDKKFGLTIALGRADSGTYNDLSKIPLSLYTPICDMINRASRYFKDCNIITPGTVEI